MVSIKDGKTFSFLRPDNQYWRHSTVKNTKKKNNFFDVRLFIPGNDLLANAQCKTFEQAVDKSLDILIKQIEMKKNK